MKPNAYRANEEIRMKAELSRKEAESLILPISGKAV